MGFDETPYFLHESSISSEPSILADATSNENACTRPYIFQTFGNNFPGKSAVIPGLHMHDI